MRKKNRFKARLALTVENKRLEINQSLKGHVVTVIVLFFIFIILAIDLFNEGIALPYINLQILLTSFPALFFYLYQLAGLWMLRCQFIVNPELCLDKC